MKCKYCDEPALIGSGEGEPNTCRKHYLQSHPKTRRIEAPSDYWYDDFELESCDLEDVANYFRRGYDQRTN